MSTKNYLIHTKKYKLLITTVHSIYRLINSTYERKDLISRLSRLICQIFDARSCQITLLDPTEQFSIFKCLISGKKKFIVDKRMRVVNRLEKKLVKTVTSVKQNYLLDLWSVMK